MTKLYDHGDREAALRGEILRGIVGSTAHGINLPGSDDRDEMGVYIEPPQNVVGISAPLDSYTCRTQPDGARSGPEDTDLMMYSLRHFLRLATAGNPSILVLLYTPEVLHTTAFGDDLRAIAPAFSSKKAGYRFLGYLEAQRERMLGGGKKSRVPNRPELVEKYGYDTKYASHALRLAYQGLDLMKVGRLQLPMPVSQRETLLKMRQGGFSFEESLELIDFYREGLQFSIETTLLPEVADLDRINAWSTMTHLKFWEATL